MRYAILLSMLLLSLVSVSAQAPKSSGSENGLAGLNPPKLRQPLAAEYSDEQYRWGTETVYFRIGKNISIPLTDSPSLQVGLDAALSTKGMTGATINRGLTVRLDITTRYGDKLALRDSIVETRLSGRGAGFKDRAILMIEPRTVELRILNPIQIGVAENGDRIFLKPGVWLLRLHCTIQSIEAENMHWYAANDSESLVVTGRTFGNSGGQNALQDPYSDLQYINPFGAFAYSLTRVGRLLGLLFRRPNIDLPATTQVFFRLDRIEATFIAVPTPAETPVLVKDH